MLPSRPQWRMPPSVSLRCGSTPPPLSFFGTRRPAISRLAHGALRCRRDPRAVSLAAWRDWQRVACGRARCGVSRCARGEHSSRGRSRGRSAGGGWWSQKGGASEARSWPWTSGSRSDRWVGASFVSISSIGQSDSCRNCDTIRPRISDAPQLSFSAAPSTSDTEILNRVFAFATSLVNGSLTLTSSGAGLAHSSTT